MEAGMLSNPDSVDQRQEASCVGEAEPSAETLVGFRLQTVNSCEMVSDVALKWPAI